MQDGAPETPVDAKQGVIGRLLLRFSELFAYIGGGIFIFLVVMSVVSIVGRKLFSAPVRGDVEMLEMGGAVAVACLFAYCEFTGGNVRVDFFTDRLPARWRHLLDAMGALLLGVVAGLIAWRTAVKAISTAGDGETSALLHIPVALAQWLVVPGFVLLCLVGLYRCGLFISRAMAPAQEALHD